MEKKKKPNKYKAVKTDGYDSKKEARRAAILKLLEKQGYIKSLQEQVKFELQPSFKIFEDNPNLKEKTVRSITYVTDFYYYDLEKDSWVAEDVKGFKTEVYRIKAKLFQYLYRDIVLLET